MEKSKFRIISGGYFNYLRTMIQMRRDKIKYYRDKIEALELEAKRCKREIELLEWEIKCDMNKLTVK